MVKRPQISDEELYDHVMRLHREYTDSSAGNFEEALETVVQLAEGQVLDQEGRDDDWYPGKHLGQFVNAISSADTSQETRKQQSQSSSDSANSLQMDPNKHPIFKTIVGDEHEITIPEAEVAAFDIEPGDLMQVITYSLEDK
jgi:hypothetical protein